MLIRYNSSLLKKLDIEAIMLFPFIFIRDKEITNRTRIIMNVYHNQFLDYVMIGIFFSLIYLLYFILIEVPLLYFTLLYLIPFIGYNVHLFIEWLIKGNIKKVSFIKQSLFMADEWKLPPENQTIYELFSWFDFIDD